MTDYLTTGFFTDRKRKKDHAPGERISLSRKEAQGFIDRRHIVDIRTTTQKPPPETRATKEE